MTAPRVWDAGLQPERTSLAWQRTALALLGVGLLVPRVAWPTLGAWSFVPSGLVVAAAVTVLIAGHRRYRAAQAALTSGGTLHDGRLPLHDGRLPLLVAGTALVIAALALGLVVASAAG